MAAGSAGRRIRRCRSGSPRRPRNRRPVKRPGQAAQAQRAQPAPAPTPAAQPGRSRWLGPIAGLAAGLGIAALLSHFGLGEAFAGAMANFIIIALVAMVAIWLIRKFLGRKRDAGTPAYAGGAPTLNSGGTGYSQEPRYTARRRAHTSGRRAIR